MDNEKNLNFGDGGDSGENEFTAENAPRARNRTVMLTPEITGQVRARLAQEMEHSGPATSSDAPSGFPPPEAHSSGASFAAPGRQNRVEPRGTPPESGHERGSQGWVSPAATPLHGSGAVNLKEGVFWTKKTKIVGFLISFDVNPNGDVFELRSGRFIVTSESAGNGNYVLISDETVSPMHAILRVGETGEIQVLDQLSEHGTRIKSFGSDKEEQLSGEKGTLEHGDIIKFGKRTFHVCVMARQK